MKDTIALDYRQTIYLIKFSTPDAAREVAYSLRGYWCDTMVILTRSVDLDDSSIPEVDHAALQLLANQYDSSYEITNFHALKPRDTIPTAYATPIPTNLEEENEKLPDDLEKEASIFQAIAESSNLELTETNGAETELSSPPTNPTSTEPESLSDRGVQVPEPTPCKEEKLARNVVMTLIEPKFILCMTLTAIVTGGVIATHIVKPDHLSNIPYLPQAQKCTVFLQEFNSLSSFNQRRSQLPQAIKCLDSIEYPKNQDYRNLKKSALQLNSNLSVLETLKTIQIIEQQKLDSTYLSHVTSHPIGRYSWLLFQYLVIELVAILLAFSLWLSLLITLDYFFLKNELLLIFASLLILFP